MMRLTWVVAVLTAGSVCWAGAALETGRTFAWTCDLPDITLAPQDDGSVRPVPSDGAWLFGLDASGAPAVPRRRLLFAAPDGMAFASLACDVAWETLAENARLTPQAEPVRDGADAPPTPTDPAAYDVETYPAAAAVAGDVETRDGVALVPVTVSPVRWSPRTGLLERAASLVVKVTFTPDATAVSRTWSEAHARMIREEVANPEAVAVGAAAGTTGTSGTLRTVKALRMATAGAQLSNQTLKHSNTQNLEQYSEPGLYLTNPETNVYEYLLFAPPDFYADWCWYADRRKETHPDLRFAVKNTADVYDEYPFAADLPCRNAAESLHAYIRKAWTNGVIQYVVLGGAWLDAQNRLGYTPYFATGEAMSLSNCVPGVYGYPREDWREIPADYFYACPGMAANERYPWDANGNGKYIDQNDCANNDLWPRLCVSRITLNPYNGGRTPYNPHALITNYVAKLKRGEARRFAGHYRYGMSAASTGSSKLRKTGDRMYYRELEFYDGMRNMFDPLHHDSLEDDEYSVRVRAFDQYSMWRPLREVKGMMNYTWTGGQPTLAKAMDDYYAADRDFGYVQAHGWAQGAAQFSAGRFATATGLTLFNGGSGPCETGYPDYHVASGGKKVLQYNVGDAAVTNPDGGALASVNNSRWSWAGGGGGWAAMSYYMLNEMLIGFNQERKDVGHAWLKGCQNYHGAGKNGGTAGWVLTEQFLYGDPLVRLPEVPNVWWMGGETGVWDRKTETWTNNVDSAKAFDAAYNVYFTVGNRLALDVADEIAAMRLSLPVLEENASLTFAGPGTLRVLQKVDVAGTNTTLRFNVRGGVGHEGIRFLTGAGNLVFEGTNKFYVAAVTNANAVSLLGGGVTLDVDEFPAGSFPLVVDGPGAAALPLPNELRSKNVGGLRRFGSLAIRNSHVKLSTVDAFGNGEPMTHTLADSQLEIAANVYYQRSGFPEGLNATFLVDGDSSVTSSLGGLWTVKHTTTFVLGPDAHLTLAADTVNAGGKIVITNTQSSTLYPLPSTLYPLPSTLYPLPSTLSIAHADALAGDVTVGEGIRLVLRELPLASVTSLTVGKGATIELPDDASGYWQIVPVSSKFTCAADVTFAVSSNPSERLDGSPSPTGAFFKEDALYKWTGTENAWSLFFANRHPKILFGDLNANDVTVRVSGAVSPEFAFFSNLRTKYVYEPADDAASILFSSVYFCGPTEMNVPVSATEYVEISTATTRFSRVTAPYVHVAAGAGLALVGSHWTEFRFDAGAILVAVPGGTLDWNADTTFAFPGDGQVLVDVGGIDLSDEPTPLVAGFGHTWTLSDLTRLRLVQPDAEFRIVDGALCVVRGDNLKGPYELCLAGSTNWNNAAWTADGTNRTPFGATWANRATDWSADVTISLSPDYPLPTTLYPLPTTLYPLPTTLYIDCDVHVNTLTICALTNNFSLSAPSTGHQAPGTLSASTLDLTACHAATEIAVGTGGADILTSTNVASVVYLRCVGSGTITLSGGTVVLDRPGDWSLMPGAQGTLRVVAPQAYERFRIAKVPAGFEIGGLEVEVTDADGRVIGGFAASVSDGALWCVPPSLEAEVPPGTNDLTRLVWRDVLGNVVSNVDWTASVGFKLIGTETSGVVIAKSGFASVWSRLSVSNEVVIYGNETLSPSAIPGGNGVLALAGAFTVKANVNAAPGLLSGSKLKLLEGTTLEIRHGSANFNATAQDWSGITGTGRILFADVANTWIALPTKVFAKTLTVATESDIVLTEGFGTANPFGVRNLSGSGRFRSDWSSGNNTRTLRTVQTGVSAFSGCLWKKDQRTSKLVVGSDDAVASTNKALVLNGAAVEDHTLDIETNGCVVLTGSWKGSINVSGLLVITNACATNGVAVSIAPGGEVRLVGENEIPGVTSVPAYVPPTYPDDPAPPDVPPTVDTRVRILTASVGAEGGTWTRLDWRDTNGVAVTAVDWTIVTNVTLVATNDAAARTGSAPYQAGSRVLFDAEGFSGVVRLGRAASPLAAAVTVEVRALRPFTLAADSVGAVDFRLSSVPTATCDLLFVTQPSTFNLQPSTSVTVHDRYGREIAVAGEVTYDAAGRKYYLNVQDVARPTYSNTFDTQYDDTLTSSLWFSGSGNLTYQARPDLFETSRAGRALKGDSMYGYSMHSHNGNPTVGMDNVNAWSLNFVVKLPTNDGGIIFGWGNKDSGNGVALARVSADRAGVYAWENGGGARLVASATVPSASTQFHAYAITHDGKTLRLYVDGALAQEVALVGKYPTRGFYQWFKMYGQNGGLQNGSSSVVDDFRLYLSCLTPTSVRAIANGFPPWPELPSASVDCPDIRWDDLYWTTEVTPGVQTEISGDGGSLALDGHVAIANPLSVVGGAVPVRVTGDGAFVAPNGISVASTSALRFDCSGLDGTNLASFAVADVPYARWILRGAYSGPVSVTALPAVPDGYSVHVEDFARFGVRLVFTAPRYARTDSVGISVGADSFADIRSTVGLHPTAAANWFPYATWTNETAAVGGLDVVGSADGRTDSSRPYGDDTSVARYFWHTSFDGNNDTYNGKSNGLTLSGLSKRFDRYRVLVYLATDTAGANFGPVTIDGRTYCGINAGDEASWATVADSTALAWGKSRFTSAREGVNVVVSDVLTNDEVSVSARRLKNGGTYARAQIAAVQVVRVGTTYAFTGTHYRADVNGTTDWDDGAGAGLARSGEWRNGTFSSLCLTAKVENATLTFNTPLTTETFRVVTAAGQSLRFRRTAVDMAVYAYDLSASEGTVTFEDGISLCASNGEPCALASGPRGTIAFVVDNVTTNQRLMALAPDFDYNATGYSVTVRDRNGNPPPESWSILPHDGYLMLQLVDIAKPLYSLTFENALDTATAGSSNVPLKAEGTATYVDSRKGRAMTGGTPYSSDLMSAVPDAWTIHAVAQMPTEANGILFGYGRNGERGVGLVGGDPNTVAVAWWDGRGRFTVIYADVPQATCQFHAYALVSTGAGVSLYVDGVFKGSSPTPVNPASPVLQIGSIVGGVCTGFAKTTTGVLDDWRLYDGVLSTNAIRELAQEFAPWPEYRKAELTQTDTAWDDLAWEGASGDDNPYLIVNRDGTLTLTNACELTNRLVSTGSALALRLTEEGVLKSDAGLSFQSGLQIDVSGLDGTNMARYAVAGAPYVRWLVRGAYSGGSPIVTGLPPMPDYYSVRAEALPDYGVRLVVTATPSILPGAVSVSVGNDDFSQLRGELGLYPDVATNWHAYANWSTDMQPMGPISVAALPMTDGKVDPTDLDKAGLPLFFRHTSFDGNGSDYDGKACGYALSNLTAFASAYRVIVYLTSDTADGWGPVTIGGRSYAGPGQGDEAASVTVSDTTRAKWGKLMETPVPREGVNAVISDVLTNDAITIVGHRNYESLDSLRARGQIAAFQVLKVGEICEVHRVDYVADLTNATAWANGAGAGLDVLSDPWTSDVSSTITLTQKTDVATLDFDTPVKAGSLKVVSADGQRLTVRNGTDLVSIAEYDFSQAFGTVSLSNDVPAGTVVDLGRETVFGGAMDGTFGTIARGATVRYAKPGLVFEGASLNGSVTNNFASAVVVGDVQVVRNYLVREGDDLTIRPAGDSGRNHSFDGHIVVEGGRLLLDSRNAPDRFWYGRCGMASFTQTGGETVANASSESTDGNGCFLFGISGSGNIPFNILGGTFSVENSPVCFWQDPNITMTVGGSGTVRVKGLWGHGTRGIVNVNAGGVLSVGTKGIAASLKTLHLNGGTLTAHANATTAKAITLGGDSVIAAEAGVTHTVSGTISGTGKITVGAPGRTGTVKFTDTNVFARAIVLAHGVLDIGTHRPASPVARTGGQVRLCLTAAEVETYAKIPILPLGTSDTNTDYIVCSPAGAPIDPDWVAVSNGWLTVDVAGLDFSKIVMPLRGRMADGKAWTEQEWYDSAVTSNRIPSVYWATAAHVSAVIDIETNAVVSAIPACVTDLTVTGAGTIVSDGKWPTYKGLTNAAWRGTVRIRNKTNCKGDDFTGLGNANSTVEVDNVSGWFNGSANYNTGPLTGTVHPYALKIGAGGFAVDNGGSNLGCTFARLTGSGYLAYGGATPTIRMAVLDASAFTGRIAVLAKAGLTIGNPTRKPGDGQLVVANGATASVSPENPWSAVGGVTFDSGSTLNVRADGSAESYAIVSDNAFTLSDGVALTFNGGNNVRSGWETEGNLLKRIEEWSADMSLDAAYARKVIRIAQPMTLALSGEGCVTVANRLDATAAKLKIDASGLDGTNLARSAVAGASYSHWLVKGPVFGDIEVTRLPTVPATYAVAWEKVDTHGVRLIVTANRAVRFGAIGVNLSGKGFEVASDATEHGAYPMEAAGWNNFRPNAATTVTTLKAVGVDDTVSNLAASFRNHTAAEYETQKGESLAILRGYHDDGVAPEFTLSGIPYGQYRLIVYFATDSANLGFAGMQAGATSATAVGYYGAAYPSANGRATLTGASNTLWGNSNVRTTLAEGVNYLVTDVLTGGGAYVKSVRNGNGRATIAAIQVVKVGEVYAGAPECDPVRLATKLSCVLPGSTITQAFDFVYHPQGADNHTWETAANWATAEVWRRKTGAIETNYTAYTGATAPALSNSGQFVPVLVDGRTVNVTTLEGWNARYGLFNGAKVTVGTQNKLQSDNATQMFMAVDETSQLTIANWGGASYDHGVNLYIAAPSGLVLKAAYDKGTAFDYWLTGKGSVCFEKGFSGTHRLRSATIELGDVRGTETKVEKKYLVLGTGAVESNVVAVAGGTRKTGDAALVRDDVVGMYRIGRDATGTFIEWVAHKTPEHVEVHPSETDEVIVGVETNQVKVVCFVTNGQDETKVDLTSAFLLEKKEAGVHITLDRTAKVEIPSIGGRAAETISVTPELGTIADDEHVSETPFVVTDKKASVGVKTIPGLVYTLQRGQTPDAITDPVHSDRATSTRLKLEDSAKPTGKAFYRIRVTP